MDDIWKAQDGNVILFSWFQFLQDESLDYLGIVDTLKIELSSIDCKALNTLPDDCTAAEVEKSNRAVQDVRRKEEILPLILQHDQIKKQETFDLSTFSCPICFEDKVGTNCLQFTGIFYCLKLTTYLPLQSTSTGI